MQDNLDKLISNALVVSKQNLRQEKILKIINDIKITIEKNKEVLIEANNIDIKNNNGFKLEDKILLNIINNLKNESLFYNDVITSVKDDKLFYGKQVFAKGSVCLLNEGNTYVIFEMILKNIISGNCLIIVSNGYMRGVNNLLTNIISTVLKINEIDEKLIQIINVNDFTEVFEKSANIDLIIGIGNKGFTKYILSSSKVPTIVSGYENFDIYVDDLKNIDFIKSIISSLENVDIYINENINIDIPNATYVSSLDEAIGLINYNGGNFSSSIFTDNNEKASKFIREVKSKNIMVNASPSIERICDISISQLTNIKTIIYPNENKTP